MRFTLLIYLFLAITAMTIITTINYSDRIPESTDNVVKVKLDDYEKIPLTIKPTLRSTSKPTLSPTRGSSQLDTLILIPYRNRKLHLEKFLGYMKNYLKDLNYRILIVEQSDEMNFNRAWLTNVGLDYIKTHGIKTKCIVQHDVDRYPVSDVDYTDCKTPIQLNSENKQWGWSVPYDSYTGGVVSMSPNHWSQINGMTNLFFGYGGEDDDLYFRLRSNSLLNGNKIRRPAKGYGRFNEWHNDGTHNKRTMDRTHKRFMNKRLNEMSGGSSIWKYDGISSLGYKLLNVSTTGFVTTIVARPSNLKVVYTALGGSNYVKNRQNVEQLAYSLKESIPDATLKVFVSNEVSQDLQHFAHNVVKNIQFVHCAKLKPEYVINRFVCYEDELKNEESFTKVAMVDSSDVYFKRDIFELIDKGVYLAREPSTIPMSKCPHHKRWITTCKKYGTPVWEQIKDNDMICAGAIFGVVSDLREFLHVFTEELTSTGCNDQGLLNTLIYTDAFKNNPPKLWKFEDNIVLHLNVAKNMSHEGAYVVHTGDNDKAIKSIPKRYFKDVLTFSQNEMSTKLLKLVDNILIREKVDYVVDGGTLIGTMLHSGRIPWDDDMDIYIDSSSREKLESVMKKNGLKVEKSYNGLYLKIKDAKRNWPFIDVGLLDGNSTHVWEKRITEKKYSHHIYKRDWMFPSKRHRYENIKVNIPSNPEAILESRFGVKWSENCVYANWNHVTDKIRYKYLGDGNKKLFMPCEKLKWLQMNF